MNILFVLASLLTISSFESFSINRNQEWNPMDLKRLTNNKEFISNNPTILQTVKPPRVNINKLKIRFLLF